MKRYLTIVALALAGLSAEATQLPAGADRLCRNQQELLYLTELYNLMNSADSANRTPQFYLDNAIRPALQAREELPWGKSIPEREFKHFVLPIRVNNEAIDAHRPAFYSELRDRVKGLSMQDAILEINHWLHEKATYQPSDGRTHSPLQTVSSAIGRCGEESTFGVAALRSMGIPARQVYTPRWAHTDDNHAWVEAWADGRWYYLGACEPEAVLNHGWFDAPATRAMLMHARVPGNDYDGPEEVLIRLNGNTDINVTSNYAPVDTISVRVVDAQGNPAPGAVVSFRIYNYAEFYPLVIKRADSQGLASTVTGLGDLIVWADNGKNFGYSKASVGSDRLVEVRLDKDASTRLTEEFNLVPPKGHTHNVAITPEQQAVNLHRFALEDSIRNAYTSTFPTPDKARAIAAELGVNPEAFADNIRLSRGNYQTIIDFMSATAPARRAKALNLLQSLSEKDLADIPLQVLTDAMTAPDIDSPLYNLYILSPRIDHEELTPFRAYFNGAFPEDQQLTFRRNPNLWVKYVADNITADRDWYPAQATMDPSTLAPGCHTSSKSRDIYFVSGARTFGIPARIDPVTSKPQYADPSGQWIDAIFTSPVASTKSDASDVKSSTSSLQLLNTPNPIVPDPKYYANFTISRIANGDVQLLNYPDFMPWSTSFAQPTTIEQGQYAIVTGQRLADGSILARMSIIPVDFTPAVDTLTVRQDTTQIQVLGSFNSEDLFQPLDGSAPCSILSRTGRGYYCLGIIRAGDEPSNHALRDIALEAAELEKSRLPVVMLFASKTDAENIDSSLLAGLPSTTTLGIDIDGTIADEIAENLRLPSSKGPIFIIADTFNRVVFVRQGYTIGLGHQLTNTIKRL